MKGYEVISVKAEVDGFLHWSSCVRRSPFWCIKEIDYNYDDIRLYWGGIAGEERNEILAIGYEYIDDWQESVRKKGRDPLKLRTGDIFVSSDSLIPATIKNMPICVVEKM